MNADDIYKKYVLGEKPRTLHGTNVELIIIDEVESLPHENLFGGPRRSGRTTREIQSLTPNSYFVSRNEKYSHYAQQFVYVDDVYDSIKFISLARYIEYRHILGKGATNGEMVGFDHTVYDRLKNKDIYDEFICATEKYRMQGYKVKLYDNVMQKLHKSHYPV